VPQWNNELPDAIIKANGLEANVTEAPAQRSTAEVRRLGESSHRARWALCYVRLARKSIPIMAAIAIKIGSEMTLTRASKKYAATAITAVGMS
jgi:hypothetical protein